MLVSVEKVIGRFSHQPWEVKRYRVDYTKNLGSSETIASSSFIVSPVSSIAPLTVTNAVVDSTGKQLIFYIGGGEDNTRYRLTVRIVTSASQRLEEEIEFWVEER